MKRTILSMVAMMAVCVFAYAQTPEKTTTAGKTTVATASAVTEDGYKDVKIETLSPQVQDAIKGYKDYTVKSTAFNAEKKLAKVTLVLKADNKTEKVVVLDEQGKEAKQDAKTK